MPARLTLKNGLEAVCEPDPRIPFVAFRLCLQAGARHDGALPGRAHLCEHLACAGRSARGVSHLERMYRAGGTTNGWTSHDYCSFADVLPSEHAAVGVAICAERLQRHGGGTIEEDVRREVRTIVQEHQERAFSPYRRELERLQQLLYPVGHPYHWPAGGVPEAIERIDVDDAVDFFRKWYHPSRAVFAAVGDLDPDWFFHEVEGCLSAHSPVPAIAEPQCDAGPSQPATARHCHSAEDISYVRTYVAYRLPGCACSGWSSASLVARAAALGRSSPLRREMGRRGVAADVRVYIEPHAEATTVAFVASAPSETSSVRLEAAFLEAIGCITSGEIGADDIERARKSELIAHFMVSDKPAVRAERLATALILQRGSGVFEDIESSAHRSTPSLLTEGTEMFRKAVETVLSVSPLARPS